MRSLRGAWGCVLLLSALVGGGGARGVGAQTIAAAPPVISAVIPPVISQGTEDALHAMTRLAGVIFAGRVAAVRRLDGDGGATGVVEIDFAVDDAVRGVSGGTYTLREWAGLWAGNEPFRVGQRYLMLLHAPGRAGLSSPVGGADGAIPILGAGRNGVGGAIDLRWIGAGAVRPVAYRDEPVGRPTSARGAVKASGLSSDAAQADLAAPTPTIEAAPAKESAGYAGVLELLRSWEKAGDAAR